MYFPGSLPYALKIGFILKSGSKQISGEWNSLFRSRPGSRNQRRPMDHYSDEAEFRTQFQANDSSLNICGVEQTLRSWQVTDNKCESIIGLGFTCKTDELQVAE